MVGAGSADSSCIGAVEKEGLEASANVGAPRAARSPLVQLLEMPSGQRIVL